jgi:hypothetical protein
MKTSPCKMDWMEVTDRPEGFNDGHPAFFNQIKGVHGLAFEHRPEDHCQLIDTSGVVRYYFLGSLRVRTIKMMYRVLSVALALY